MSIAPARRPMRYRRDPNTPAERERFLAEIQSLLEQAHDLDEQQRALAAQFADVRTDLAHLRVVMWPRVDPKDIVVGYRRRRVNGPAPIPPAAPNAYPLRGRDLRFAALAVLATHDRPMSLVEIHRALHLGGYVVDSRFPVKRLGDALGYEERNGRAYRVKRGVYELGKLSPAERRRAEQLQPRDDLGHETADFSRIAGDAAPGRGERFDLGCGGAL